MNYLIAFTVFLLLLAVNRAWEDYADYYDAYTDLDDYEDIQVEVDVGAKVFMVCNYTDLYTYWKHNNDVYMQGFATAPNVKWVDVSSIEVNIVSEQDGGKWICYGPHFPLLTYYVNVTSKTSKELSTTKELTTTSYSFEQQQETTHPQLIISSTVPSSTTNNTKMQSATTSRIISNLEMEEIKGEGETIGYIIAQSLKNPFYRNNRHDQSSTGSLHFSYVTLFTVLIITLNLR